MLTLVFLDRVAIYDKHAYIFIASVRATTNCLDMIIKKKITLFQGKKKKKEKNVFLFIHKKKQKNLSKP